MPKITNRPLRPQQIVEYFNNLKTPEQKIDFICTAYFLYNEAGTVDDSELDALTDHFGDVFWPRKTVDGKSVLDVEAAEKAYKTLAEIEIKNQIEIGKEYKRIYDSLPENQENRKEIAAYMTKSSPAYLRNRSMSNIKFGLMHDEDGLSSQRTINEIPTEAYENACLYMTQEEKDLFEIGRDICNIDTRMLKGVKLKDLDLNQKDLDDAEKKSIEQVAATLDTNWQKDETMDAVPRFISPIVSNSYFNKMRDQYISLNNTEDKLNAIIDGMVADKLRVDTFNEEGKFSGKKDINVYNQQEKDATFRSVDEFFCPLKADGTPDFDEFERRMDAMAAKVGKMRSDFLDNTFQGDLMKSNESNLKYEGLRTDPNIIKANCVTEYMNQIMDMNKASGRIHKKFAIDYANRKGENDLKDAFERQAMNAACQGGPYKKAVYTNGFNTEDIVTLSDKERVDINKKELEVKAKIASDINAKKTWLNPPEESTSLEDLRKLSNLYEQVKDADHWYHKDGDKFKKFKASLKDAHDLYQELKDKKDNELSSIERGKIAYSKDKVAISSDKYLMGKGERARHSDLGQDRYEIAFSALDVACHGFAKKRAYIHNIKHTKRGTKTITLEEMEARSGRTVQQQKQHQREQKNAQKVNTKSKDKPFII